MNAASWSDATLAGGIAVIDVALWALAIYLLGA